MNQVLRTLAHSVSGALRRTSSVIGPSGRFEALFTLGEFVREHDRLPRHPSRADAGIMDYFFWRKHQVWDDLVARCCDKELAKIEAVRLCPDVKVPRTVASIPLRDVSSADDLRRRVTPFLGQQLVMKPAHSNGGVVFLDQGAIDYDQYLAEARRDFFHAARERQYHGLQPKLIIEEVLRNTAGQLPEDFKFFCFNGQPIICQIDSDRFTSHKRRLYLVPEWRPLAVSYTYPTGDSSDPRPVNLDQALERCARLSAPFDFARIDLYMMGTDVFFGEFTFTPDAGLKRFSDNRFDVALLEVLKTGARDAILPFARHL